MNRIQMLENAYENITKYSQTEQWRPGVVDLVTYDALLGMYEDDYEGIEPNFLWLKKPDEVMEHIIEKGYVFDLSFGLQQLDEEIRDYLILENFIVDPYDVSDEEYKDNLEGK